MFSHFHLRLQSNTHREGGVTQYQYDAQDRIIQVTAPNGVTTRYEYDIINRKTKEISPDRGTISYTYDRLTNDDLNDNHLMTNRLATDDTQQVVWRWEGEAFGNTPAEELGGVSVNLRFPRQYYDQEINLYYNHFRYYDSVLGRYITSDSLGLDAGYNTYNYALANPIFYYDSDGKNPFAVAQGGYAIGGVLNAGINYILAITTGATLGDLIYEMLNESTKDKEAEKTIPAPPGDCSASYQRYLQDQVNSKCKPNPGNCVAGEPCVIMYAKLVAHNSCAAARKNINDTCFRGGDRGHQIAYTIRKKQAAMCLGVLPCCQ